MRAHARDILPNVPGAAVIGRDLLEPEEILAGPAPRALIDFGGPATLRGSRSGGGVQKDAVD